MYISYMHAHTLNIYFFIKFRIVKLYENRHICIYGEIHDCIVHGVTKSWTWLSDFHFHFLHICIINKQMNIIDI